MRYLTFLQDPTTDAPEEEAEDYSQYVEEGESEDEAEPDDIGNREFSRKGSILISQVKKEKGSYFSLKRSENVDAMKEPSYSGYEEEEEELEIDETPTKSRQYAAGILNT